MQVWAGIFGTAINTFAPKKADEMDVQAVTQLINQGTRSDNEKSSPEKSSSDDEDTLSTIHSDDSAPYRKAKEKQLEKRRKRKRTDS